MSHDLQIGDVVRVKNPEGFLVSFGNKIRDRDAIVIAVGNPQGHMSGRIKVRFQKRNGRGKEFEEWMQARELEKKQ